MIDKEKWNDAVCRLHKAIEGMMKDGMPLIALIGILEMLKMEIKLELIDHHKQQIESEKKKASET